MCGIAGAKGKDSEILVRKMLEVMKHRGPDGRGICSLNDITVGSVMLKITGSKTQPIRNSGVLAYNGEVYNFPAIAKRLGLNTDSDIEALFVLIESEGFEAGLEELDGDYAFAYVSDDSIQLARDPAGVKPLFYGMIGDSFAFASEKKALFSTGATRVLSLKPGHMLIRTSGSLAEKKITGFNEIRRINDEKIATEALFNAIERAVKKRIYSPFGLAFSGGLDSSFIAALCPVAELFSVAMADSHDIAYTKIAADKLGLKDKLHLHELSLEEVESAIPLVILAIESADPLKTSIALPLFFASKDAHMNGIRVMLSGQGADELFAGYKRYESMSYTELENALRLDLENIADNNLERDDAVTMANAIELRVPYLDRDVVELALGIAPELKINGGIRKYILRLAAEKLLPHELVWKEKRAAQYSSGIYSALKKIARKNKYTGKRALGRYLESFIETA